MPPLVSIVMSVYNGLPYLPATLDSLLRQHYQHFELLITDDGSTDGTGAALSLAAAADARVRVFHNERNLGVPASMNRLFSLAGGDYVVRHDADDLSAPERLSKQVAYLEQHARIGLLASRVQLIDAPDQPLAYPLFAGAWDNARVQAELLRKNCLCQGSVMFRRRLLDSVGGYEADNIGSEDYDFWLRLAEITEIAVLDDVLYHYRLHPGSLSHRRRPEQIYYAARAIEQAVRRRAKSNPPAEQFRAAAETYVQAALSSFQAGDEAAAQRWLAHSLALCPALFDRVVWLRPHLEDLASRLEPLAGRDLIVQVFARLLPRRWRLRRLRGQLLSDWHMRHFFGGQSGSGQAAVEHLWPGVWHNPAWLTNRGVWSRLARALVRRGLARWATSGRR